MHGRPSPLRSEGGIKVFGARHGSTMRCCMSGVVQVSRMPAGRCQPRALWPASEKRQGTKSREVVAGGAAGAMGIEAGRDQ